MGAKILAHDWSASPLGQPENWPISLRSAVTTCINTPILSAVHWGPELITFYNDAYAPALAERHPWALGKPFSEVWAEIWHVLGPQIATVLATGRGFSTDRQNLKMNRRGRIEDTWWVYSFAPLYGDDGLIDGINVTAMDVTAANVAEQALRDSEVDLRSGGPRSVVQQHVAKHLVSLHRHRSSLPVWSPGPQRPTILSR